MNPQEYKIWQTGKAQGKDDAFIKGAIQAYRNSQGEASTVTSPISTPDSTTLAQKIWSGIGSDLQNRKQNIASIPQGKQSGFSTGFQTAGQVAGGVSDIVKNVIAPVIAPAAQGIASSIQQGNGLIGQALHSHVAQTIGSQFKAAKQLVEMKMQSDPKFAEIMRNIGAAGNIGQSILDAWGIEGVGKVALEAAPKLAESAINAGGKIGETISKINPLKASTDLEKTIDIVSPKLTATEEAAAKAAGRGTTKGKIIKRTVLNPSSRELEMAQYANEAGVAEGNTFDKNIRLMKDAQRESAVKLRSGLQDSPAIWNQNELKSTLSGIEKPLTIKSDKVLNRLADNFREAILKLAESQDKKAVGLLDLRQELDGLIDREFPANIYTKDTPIGQYVRKTRQAINDLTESKLPDGVLPSGSTFKGELRKQSLLYDAIENVAEKAPRIGESAHPFLGNIRKFAKKHPVITGAVTAIGGEKILKKLGVPVP